MGVISYIKEEIKVVKERDPAIKSDIEVLLYQALKVMLHYRIAHKLYLKKTLFSGTVGVTAWCQKDRN